MRADPTRAIYMRAYRTKKFNKKPINRLNTRGTLRERGFTISGKMKKMFDELGLSFLEKYDEFFDEQNGRCAICHKPPKEGKRLHMDHDHETLQPRGLLCYSCNTKLGFVEKYLDQIARYLS